MSLLPARPCTAPGCPALVRGSGSKCERHAPKYDDRRGNSQERGYDVYHRRLRLLCFERDNWRCVDCGFQPEIVRLYERCNAGLPDTPKILEELRVRCNNDDRHLHADHIVPIAERPDLRLELSNLATRCDRCHRIKTARELFHPGRSVYV